MKYFTDTDRLIGLLREMLSGTLVTLEVWALTLLFALPLGLLICQMRMARNGFARGVAKVYIFYFRGSPLMLQLMFMFFGVPIIAKGILSLFGSSATFTLDRTFAAILAFILNYAAYFAEIYRGGIQSIPRGQYEAAHVLGLSNKVTFFKIILPQVAKRIIPPIGNEVITLVKDTALVYVIALQDMLFKAKAAVNRDFSVMPFVIAAIFYLVMTGTFSHLLTRIERKFDYYK
ncbi:MAG: amino acid ABC transporter permease [Christensenellales bacterium]|jgi:polar amino acid transport system permease protein